ncbi:hypothetical protein D3C87_1491670 [compost metagenome]
MVVLRFDIEHHGQLMLQDAACDAAGEGGTCRRPQIRERAVAQFPAEQVAQVRACKAEEWRSFSLVRQDEEVAEMMFQLCGIEVFSAGRRFIAAQRVPIGIYLQSGHALHSIFLHVRFWDIMSIRTSVTCGVANFMPTDFVKVNKWLRLRDDQGRGIAAAMSGTCSQSAQLMLSPVILRRARRPYCPLGTGA